ncbi:hypothetical protein AV656_14680 [Bhargavaea cecembensis]|uniref:YhfM-like domain-containing protein n=1 Tax=Bhargavaea cecembensis TaxID=394098 RepID=A0A163EFB4_9BACL|nr:hypothetical protein [Bhargavaea cecembensis]KZE36386.1 hypothetical protein AV656_14680 [Bhargavaea cecembensis]
MSDRRMALSKVALIVVSLALFSCNATQNESDNDEITVQQVKSYSEDQLETLKEISNADEIEVIEHAINRAVETDGIADMDEPEYKLNMGNDEYYIWVGLDETASIMDSTDTNTVYTISSAQDFINVIQK